MLSLGGQLLLIDGSGNRIDPVDGKLPETPFAVQYISISNGAKVKDEPHPHQLETTAPVRPTAHLPTR